MRRSCGLQVAPERIVEERRIIAGQIADRAAGEAAAKKAAEERDAKAKAEAEKVEEESVKPLQPDAEEGQDAERGAKQSTPAGSADVEDKKKSRRKGGA